MKFQDAQKIVESLPKRPIQTLLIIVVALVFAGIVAWINGFFGAKGAQKASHPGQAPLPLIRDLPEEQRKYSPAPHIYQHTQGDQSPAINVDRGGQSNLSYGSEKSRTSGR